MNPARSLGPAVAEWDGSDLWIHLVGPPIGALAGALLDGWLRADRPTGRPDAAGPAPEPATKGTP
jgi:hypothetical protein